MCAPLFARAIYRPSCAGSDVHYVSDEAAVEPIEWSGYLEIMEASATRFEATFEFVLWDGRAEGPPYPSVTVTGGCLLFTYK